MMQYEPYSKEQAYMLQNGGGLVLVCTKGSDGRYDLAPVAWCCPLDYAPLSRFICVLDTGHRSFKDLKESGEFVIALPSALQKDLVRACGSISGSTADKYEKFKIESFMAHDVDARIPENVAGWIECRLSGIRIEGTSAIVMGDCLSAAALPDFWRHRLHYVSDGTWFEASPLKD
jgi:flavin reductase (DIM6/NTAB) family NADH-FMN oxidoreductase RutF